MIIQTRKNANGTSFHGTTISTTVGRLKELFPYYDSQNDGTQKSNYDFTLENNGEVFTIYDWKEYRPIKDDEVISFHIGGHSVDVTENAKRELMKLL